MDLIYFYQVLFAGHVFYVIFHHPGNTWGSLRFTAVPVVAVDAVSVFRFYSGLLISDQQ
jgi:hypothetical protein